MIIPKNREISGMSFSPIPSIVTCRDSAPSAALDRFGYDMTVSE
jgi:hypothetical protein